MLGNGKRGEQGQKIKKFDVQSWEVQLKSQISGRVKVAKQIISRLPLIMRAELKRFRTGGRISISEGNPEPGSDLGGEESLLCTPGLAPLRTRVVLVQAQQLPGVLNLQTPQSSPWVRMATTPVPQMVLKGWSCQRRTFQQGRLCRASWQVVHISEGHREQDLKRSSRVHSCRQGSRASPNREQGEPPRGSAVHPRSVWSGSSRESKAVTGKGWTGN